MLSPPEQWVHRLISRGKLFDEDTHRFRWVVDNCVNSAAHEGLLQVFTPTQEKMIVDRVLKCAQSPCTYGYIASFHGQAVEKHVGDPIVPFPCWQACVRLSRKRLTELFLRNFKATNRYRRTSLNSSTAIGWLAPFFCVFSPYLPAGAPAKNDMDILPRDHILQYLGASTAASALTSTTISPPCLGLL